MVLIKQLLFLTVLCFLNRNFVKCELKEYVNPICYFSSKGDELEITYTPETNSSISIGQLNCSEWFVATNTDTLNDMLGGSTCFFDGGKIIVSLAEDSDMCDQEEISIKLRNESNGFVPLDVRAPQNPEPIEIKLNRDIIGCEDLNLIYNETNPDVRPLHYHWIVRNDEFLTVIESFEKDFYISTSNPNIIRNDFYYIKLTVSRWCNWLPDDDHEILCKSLKITSIDGDGVLKTLNIKWLVFVIIFIVNLSFL